MANIDDIQSREIVLEYPCIWEYKIITPASTDIKALVKSVLEDREYTLKDSKSSTKGGYKSYSLSLTVNNDSERKFIYEEIRSHNDVKIVL